MDLIKKWSKVYRLVVSISSKHNVDMHADPCTWYLFVYIGNEISLILYMSIV